MSIHNRAGLLVTMLATFMAAGCASTADHNDPDGRRKMLELVMPSRIEIVEPFTRVKSFDGDGSADGIEVLLQAVNPLGNAGLMIVGTVRIELCAHVKASGNRIGKRLDSWEIDLSSEEAQHRYWNHVTQMYAFKLRINADAITPASQHVLVVTYTSPLGEHLTDDCIIEQRAVSGPLGGARARSD